jgi:hypothetical protein
MRATTSTGAPRYAANAVRVLAAISPRKLLEKTIRMMITAKQIAPRRNVTCPAHHLGLGMA